MQDENDLHCCETLRCVQVATQRRACWDTARADVEDVRPLKLAGLSVLESDEGATLVPWITTQLRSSVRKTSRVSSRIARAARVEVLMVKAAFVARKGSTQELGRLRDFLHGAIQALGFEDPSKP